MTLSLTYALRDLRGALASLRIVLACLILGVATIAAVQSLSSALLSGIEKNGRAILGGDLIVRTLNAPASEPLRAALMAQGAVLTDSIEARVMAANEGTGDNTLVELKAVEAAYPLYGAFESDAGTNAHAAVAGRGVLLDPALGPRLGLAAGDTMRIGEALFTVKGFIRNEPDRAGGSRFGLAPRVMIAADDMAATGFLGLGSMIYYDLRVKLAPGTPLAPLVADLKNRFGDEGLRIRDADNASPQVSEFIERLSVFLTLVGLSALLVGGMGIGNGLRAHFETRLKTIAILKSVGASRVFVQQIYLWQIAIIALAGTTLGLTIGVAALFGATPLLSALMPFPVEPSIHALALLVPFLFGLLTAFLFALWPLGQAVETSPLELFRTASAPLAQKVSRGIKFAVLALSLLLAALAVFFSTEKIFALWFIAGALFCLALFYAAGRGVAMLAGHLPPPRSPSLRLGVRNLHRPGNATANTLLSLGLGLTVIATVTLVELNLRYGVQQNLPADAPAFFFLDIQPDQKDSFVELLEAQPTAQTIRLSPNLRGRIVAVNGVPAEEALVDRGESWLLQNDRSFTYTDTIPAHSEILAGAWWPEGYTGPPLISVVDDVQRAFGVGPGDQITVNILGRDITAEIANVRSVNWMNFTINFAITFSPGVLESAPHTWLATVVADPAREAEIQRGIGAAFPNISMIRLSDAVEAAGGILKNIAAAARAIALVAVVTGILVLAGSLAATRAQRLYDTVVLKVLGIRRSTLLAGFFFEFALLGAAAAVISLLLGSVISWAVMTGIMDLPWRFYPVPAALTLAAGVGVTLLVGWMTTGRVLSAPAAPVLRNE
jgi:putative ABC transport system permease protein